MSDTNQKNRPKTQKERQTEKMRQEMQRRKEAEEAQKQALAAKKKRTAIIVIAVLSALVIIGIAVGVPLGLRNKAQYKAIDFQSFAIPTDNASARNAAAFYNNKQCVMEGYLAFCDSTLLVLCKEAVSGCPYTADGKIPSNGILIKKANNSSFPVNQSGRFAKVYGTLIVNSHTVTINGNTTFAYMEVDKVELLD